jgi:hypothetical protein
MCDAGATGFIPSSDMVKGWKTSLDRFLLVNPIDLIRGERHSPNIQVQRVFDSQDSPRTEPPVPHSVGGLIPVQFPIHPQADP